MGTPDLDIGFLLLVAVALIAIQQPNLAILALPLEKK